MRNKMRNKFIAAGLLAALLAASAYLPASAQTEKKNAKPGQNCVQKCNAETPPNQAGRDRTVNTCIRSCRAGQ
jgi:hypothetical protein